MNPVFKLLKLLNSDAKPWQISLAFVLGMMMGMAPLYSLSNLFLLFFVCVIRLNIGAFLLSLSIFSGIAWMFDQSLLAVGEWALLQNDWQVLWTSLYQSDLWRLSHFNNTLMMGAWIVSVALALPLYILTTVLVVQYRERFMAWIERTKLMRWIKMSKWYQRGAKAMDIAEELA